MAVRSDGDRKGGRLPRGPHQLTGEEVAADQRQRLIDAMVQLAGESGYASTTVADIISRAEVSRKTFYAHFADREGLLLAAFDQTSSAALQELHAGAQRPGGPTIQFEALTRRLCRIAAQNPGLIALSTIEITAIDPTGLERRDRLIDNYGELLSGRLRSDGEQHPQPPMLVRALAGGTYRTIDAQQRLAHGGDLALLAPPLARWIRSYHPVPPSLKAAQVPLLPWPSLAPEGLLGGRAPGTLTLAPSDYRPTKQLRTDGFLHHSNRERILDAVAQLTTTHGYAALSAQAVAERADISERAFLAQFKSKDHAFATAMEIGHLKAQALIVRARTATPDWRTGVRDAIHALLEFLASEPYFTRLAFIDAPLASPYMARRTYEHAGAYARLLLEGAPQRRRPPVLSPETTVHGLFELAFHHAAQNKIQELLQVTPIATYLAMAPYTGATEAADIATAPNHRYGDERAGTRRTPQRR